MGISDLLGKRQSQTTDGAPVITGILPPAALPGGEVKISGRALVSRGEPFLRPKVTFGDAVESRLMVTAEEYLIARVPEGAQSGAVTVAPATEHTVSSPSEFKVAVQIADGIHAVANPAVDAEGNIFTTLSGQRGEETAASIYKLDTDFHQRAYAAGIMNATGLAVGPDGQLYVSSRHEGSIYRIAANGNMSVYAQGMGVATGIAFDREGNLYAGDRSGSVFKISREREIYVFATLEPSVAAYHLAFDYADNLYVSAPTTTSSDPIYMIDPDGQISEFYRGLGRPQGLAFDTDGNLYVAASLGGRRGVVRITPQREAALVIAGNGVVGLAFTPTATCILATSTVLYQLSWGIHGKLLSGA
ncbi:MAG: gluconolaconase [Acidobacteriaceae bacterium]